MSHCRFLFLLSALLVLVGAGPASAQSAALVNLNPSVTPGDGNRDPNWDWTQNLTYTIYPYNLPAQDVLLPYYGQGPAGADLNLSTGRDIYPAEGWVLVVRNFGSPSLPTKLPYFILYNKYRGLLRLFYWSPLSTTVTRAAAKLYFQTTTPEKTAALMTFLGPDAEYVNSYNPQKTQIAIGRMEPFQWGYFDFDLSGYDPNLAAKTDPTFIIDIHSIQESQIQLQGTIQTDTGTTTAVKGDPGNALKNVINGAIAAYEKPAKRYKQISDAKTIYDTMANNNSTTWWGSYLKGISNLLGKDWLKALGPVAGFVEAILGFGSSSGSHAPLLINATVKLNGSMTEETLFATLLLRAPGSIHADPVNDASSNILPLYNRPLGIFNLVSAPLLSLTNQSQGYPCYVPFTNPRQITAEICRKSTDQRLAKVDYVVNPDSGLEVEALDAAYLRAAALPDFYVQGSSDGYRPLCDLEQTVVHTSYSGCPPSLGYCPENYTPPNAEVRTIGLRVRLRVTASPTIEPTLLIRKYKPTVTSSTASYACSGFCSGTAGQWSGCGSTSGCKVCSELVSSYPLYFFNHLSCVRENACNGQYFTCNASCPSPTSADQCFGTSGQWAACRGTGCHVCAEKVSSYPLYFKNHPACIPNTGCAGAYFTCNANCPAPTSADQCFGTSGQWAGCRGTGCHVCSELVAQYPCYFQNHPYCVSNGGCAGAYFTCNANCPAPTQADLCN